MRHIEFFFSNEKGFQIQKSSLGTTKDFFRILKMIQVQCYVELRRRKAGLDKQPLTLSICLLPISLSIFHFQNSASETSS